MMTGFARDIRFAFRVLRLQPTFTMVALLTLALGIGATTAIFSVVNAIVLRPLPYPQSDRLVRMFENNQRQGWNTFSVAAANFADWARESRTFRSMTAFGGGSSAIVVNNEAQQVPTITATSEYFTVVQAAPALGRTFDPGDDVPGAPPVAVIGHGVWQRRFGGDRSVIGRVVSINDRPTTIVGVMKEGFGRGAQDTDLWLPLTIDRASREGGGRTLGVLGRLADGATIEQARGEMRAVAERLSQAYPGSNTGWGVTLVSLEESAVGQNLRRAIVVLFGAVVCVLLIACVNVASLLSARGVARRRELAIRRALGANRWRIVRQLFTESLVLALVGGLLGIFVAAWGVQLLLALAPRNIPRLYEVSIDPTVLAAGLVITLLAAVVFGMGPALEVITVRSGETLSEAWRSNSASPRWRGLSHGFVVAETALAVVLLVGSGLLVRSFVKLTNQPIGFDPDQTLVFGLNLPEARYGSPQAVTEFYRNTLDRIRAMPGVRAAGATHALPFSGMDSVRPFIREGESLTADNAPTSEYRLITPGYFSAMGIPVSKGREFNDSDTAGQPGAAIVNESFARRFLGGRDPIGQRIRQGGDNPEIPWLTIVGVVGDVRHSGLGVEMVPEMFWPEAQSIWGATLNRHRRGLTIVVRTAGDPAAAIASIRAQVAAIDPNRPMINAVPMRDLIRHSADVPRFSMALLTFFAAAGLVLAMAGVYGLTSYIVASRRREMGIRLALGAKPRALLQQVLRTALVLAALGSALGLVVAWQLSEVIRTQLFQTPPIDLVSFAGAAILLIGTALLASVLPARRAAAVDPIQALREQ
jgi:putative ABC transport system permease protein